VEVDAQGDWWDAEVIKVKQGQAKVHYEGGTEAEQEWITFDRFSPPPLASATTRVSKPCQLQHLQQGTRMATRCSGLRWEYSCAVANIPGADRRRIWASSPVSVA